MREKTMKLTLPSWEKLNEYAREYHAEVQQGFGKEVQYIKKDDDDFQLVDNRSDYQKDLAKKIVSGALPYFYKVAEQLFAGKGITIRGNTLSLKGYKGRVSLDDLVNTAVVKIIQVLHNYDPAKGALSTFMTFTSAAAMVNYAKEKICLIKVPREVQNSVMSTIFNNGYKMRTEAVEEIAEKMNKDIFSAAVIYDGMMNDYPHVQTFHTDDKAQPDLESQQAELEQRVRRVLALLTPREELILRLRFGIGNDQDKTQREIGRELKVSKRRVQQIEANAIRKLKKSYRSQYLQEFVE